jgi:hypothetical protein
MKALSFGLTLISILTFSAPAFAINHLCICEAKTYEESTCSIGDQYGNCTGTIETHEYSKYNAKLIFLNKEYILSYGFTNRDDCTKFISTAAECL